MKNLVKLVLLLNLILICTQVNAQEYYADLTFDIQQDGSTTILGTTNYSPLNPKNTQELTSKLGKTWTIFIDSNEQFSEYSYKILLPEGAKIQRITTNSTYFIQTQSNKIIIEGFGENINFKIKIEYTLNQTQQNNFLFEIIGLIILLIIGSVLFIIFRKITANKTKKMEEFDADTITERQLSIIKELEKKNGKNTQAEIQKTLNLPKASLFRNIIGLEKKGILRRERKGMAMLLILQKKPKK